MPARVFFDSISIRFADGDAIANDSRAPENIEMRAYRARGRLWRKNVAKCVRRAKARPEKWVAKIFKCGFNPIILAEWQPMKCRGEIALGNWQAKL